MRSAPAAADAGSQSVAYQLDPGHDGYASGVSLAPPLTRAWSETLSGAISYPLIVGGQVFVTAAGSGATNVYAINQGTGAIEWQKPISGTYPWSGLAYDGGRVFVVNSGGLLTALDAASGTSQWSTQLPGQYSFSSPPTAVGGIVYDGGAGSGGTLYATRESDGKLLWSQSVANGDNSSPAVDGSNVYVTYPDNYYAFNRATGAPVWHDALGGDGGGGRTPVIADGQLFIRDPVASGVIANPSTGISEGPLGSSTAPAVASGTAYELGGSTLEAIGSDGLGVSRWSFIGDGHLDSAPLVTSNAAWVGSSTGKLYAVSCTTGQPIWSTNVGAAIPAPDEQNVSQPLTGLGVGGNTLVVPAGSTLVAYTSSSTSGAGSCGAYNPPSAPGGSTPGNGAAGTAPASGSAGSTGTTPRRTAASSPVRTASAAMLQRDLMLHTTIRQLIAHHSLTLRLSIPSAGQLALAWAFAPAGVKTKHPLIVAVALRAKRAGSGRVTLRLDARAIRTLRRARRGLVVGGAAAFKPSRGTLVKTKRSFRIAQ